MTRLRGRAMRGKRLHASAPCGRWRSTTMIGAIRLDGDPLGMSMTIEGATDTDVFRAYVEGILCPKLHPGDIVIMDNLGAHKSPGTLALIQAAGAEVKFLPAYSPDFNPIEKMWSKVKGLLRSAEARTQEQLEQAIAAALAKVTAKDAMGWFASCGYSII
jgi:transposase